MRPPTTLFSPFILTPLLLLVAPLTHAQNAAAGGGAAAATAPTQYPTIVTCPSMVVGAGGATSTTQVAFTQKFVTPLGTWAFATPSVGSVGLGGIQGVIGTVRGG